MKKLKIRLLMFSIIFALLSAGVSYIYLSSLDESEEEEIEMFTIIVAATHIPARTLVTEDLIEEIEVAFQPRSMEFVSSKDELIGMYVKNEVYKDSQIHKNNIMLGDEEELSVKISGNMRAISISVNGNTGVANLIKPGDKVDIVVFLPELKENQLVVRPDIVKILLQNIEVLAIDQDLTSTVEEEIGEVENASSKSYIATLAIPVFEVETLILAKDIGILELALRPIDGDYVYVTEGRIWQELLLDDFDKLKDMFPNYDVNNVGKVLIDPDKVKYEKYVYYTVKYGDTLRKISLLFYGTEDDYILLKEVNNLKDENIITAGMGIKVPVIENRGVESDED